MKKEIIVSRGKESNEISPKLISFLINEYKVLKDFREFVIENRDDKKIVDFIKTELDKEEKEKLSLYIAEVEGDYIIEPVDDNFEIVFNVLELDDGTCTLDEVKHYY